MEAVRGAPAPGWAGERVVHRTGNDWEPAVATDPDAPFVYILHNRYGGEDACANHCPDPAMILHVSKDGGKTWRPERYLCTCKGWKAQYDPLIEVVPDTGDVVAVWMNQFQIHFSRSIDHGRTWSKPIFVHPDVGGDHRHGGEADGQDVYGQFTEQTGGDAYSSMSHDARHVVARAAHAQRPVYSTTAGRAPGRTRGVRPYQLILHRPAALPRACRDPRVHSDDDAPPGPSSAREPSSDA